ETEVQFQFAAVRAFKSRRKIARERQSAAFAKRRAGEADMRPAGRADQPLARGGAGGVGEVAGFRVDEAEAGFEPVLHVARNQSHAGNLFSFAAAERQFGKKFCSPPVPSCVKN